jgi:tetratricopeptide (TPR) repeat protein
VLAAVIAGAAMLSPAARAFAGSLDEAECGRLFTQGSEAYEGRDYGGAVRAYHQILDGGRESAAVHFNLGNSYLKLGELGEAMASYRRAELLSPRSADIRENLGIARSRRADLAPPEALSPLGALRAGVSRIASFNVLATAANIAYYVTAALAVIFLLGRGGAPARRVLYVAAPVAALLLSLVYLELADRSRAEAAVLVAPQAEARSGPGTEYTTLFTLHEAAEFRVEEERRGWSLISMGGNLRGWIPTDTVEPISWRGGPDAPS